MAVERLAELPEDAIASVIFMLVTQQAESARMPSATLITDGSPAQSWPCCPAVRSCAT